MLHKIQKTMKRILAYLLAVLTGAVAISCNSQEEEATGPVLKPITESVTAEAEGGHYEIAYTIVDPVGNLSVQATSEQEWIGTYTYGEGTIGFDVAVNESEESRNGTILVSYGNQSFTVPVTQLASDGVSFEFDLQKMTSTGVTIDVRPSDKTIYYTWNILEKSVADEKYGDDNALITYALQVVNDDLEYYRNYVDQNGSLADVLSWADDLTRINTLDPATEYQIFAFGIDEKSGAANTTVTRHNFSTPEFQIQDECRFAIRFDDVLQTEMTFTVTPDNPSTRYYVGVCPTEMFDAQGADAIALEFIRQGDVAGVDWSAHSALHSGELTVNTFEDMGLTTMEPGVSYTVVVFGVSDLGERTTAVSHAAQTLPEVVPSDMTFDISLVEQTESGAILKIVPSVKDEPYIAGVMQYGQYSEYIGRDEEFMNYVVEFGGMGVYEGDYVMDRSTALISDTEYVCFAFGYSGGITTPLTLFRFTTGKPDTGGEASVEITEIRIIDGSEVGYDGMAAVYAYLAPNASAAHWYAQAMMSENGVPTDMFGNTFSDTELVNLLTNPNNSSRYVDSEYVATPVDWGTEITFCIIAEDSEGNLGQLIKRTVIPEQ